MTSASQGHPPALAVEGFETGYGDIQVLRGISLELADGEIVALLGANGAGKTTLLRAVSGLLPAWSGTIALHGREVQRARAARRARLGIGHVAEGRMVFAPLTVEENLELGSLAATPRPGRAERDRRLGGVHELFPRLAERREQLAGTLSGGEQQMLAIGRALMADPTILMLDEPSLGLAPQVSELIFERLELLAKAGTTMLLAEQNALAALEIADRAYVLRLGDVVRSARAAELSDEEEIRTLYFGKSLAGAVA